jgi:hypothetical protein
LSIDQPGMSGAIKHNKPANELHASWKPLITGIMSLTESKPNTKVCRELSFALLTFIASSAADAGQALPTPRSSAAAWRTQFQSSNPLANSERSSVTVCDFLNAYESSTHQIRAGVVWPQR